MEVISLVISSHNFLNCNWTSESNLLLFKIIQLIIKNISSNLTSRLLFYTFKTARISHNESHLVLLPAWNVLEAFLSCKLSSPLQDPCWSSSACPACVFLAVVYNLFFCYSYWETDFYSTASSLCVSHSDFIFFLCFIGYDLCLSQRYFHIPWYQWPLRCPDCTIYSHL